MRDVRQGDVVRVGLLQCDHVSDTLRGIAGDYDDMFRALLAEVVPRVELAVFDVTRCEYPESPSDCDGYLISGSSASVYDDLPWIESLEKFISQLHTGRIPTVGVCFGHQMIARVLGGEVAMSDRGWGIGVKPSPITTHRAWMRPKHDTVAMVVSHQDQVLTLPSGAELLGGYPHCPLAIYGVGDHMLCMQGHPEYSTAYARALAVGRADRIPAGVFQDAEPSFGQPTDAQILAQWITNFITDERR